MTESPLANYNGYMMHLSEVRIPALDRGFMFGDAVYEVIRVYHGRLFRPDAHLERLAQSMSSLNITGIELSLIEQRLRETLLNSTVVEGLAYIQVTRGEAPRRSHTYTGVFSPNVLIFVDHFDDPYAVGRTAGISVVTHPDIRWKRNDIKVTSLIANCMAAQYAMNHHCQEVVLYNEAGYITEGSHTSVFAARDGKLIVAPDSPSVLPGITKALVLELAAAAGIECRREFLLLNELRNMDEFFITGTPEEIVPVVRVDERPIGNGKVGPLVARLQSAFSQLVEKKIHEESFSGG